MSRLFAVATALRALLRDPQNLSRASAEALRYFDEVEDDGETEVVSGRIGRGIQRAIGERGYSRATRADEWQYLQNGMRLVNSSNVYGYTFDQIDARKGVLYVQFLDWTPRKFGGTGERSGPGPVYGYFNFPVSKFNAFEDRARESAGKAVWDYCRIRGTHWGHQHPYQLIQVSGDYVPRKATRAGFRGYYDPQEPGKRVHGRMPAAIGIGVRNAKGQIPRQQLETRLWERSALDGRGRPRRNGPNRGGPNRGEPNRG